jgi:hypothetical protein
MKRWFPPFLLLLGVAIVVVSVWLGTNEGIVADAEGRGGNVVLFIIGAALGLAVSVIGLIGVLTPATQRKADHSS